MFTSFGKAELQRKDRSQSDLGFVWRFRTLDFSLIRLVTFVWLIFTENLWLNYFVGDSWRMLKGAESPPGNVKDPPKPCRQATPDPYRQRLSRNTSPLKMRRSGTWNALELTTNTRLGMGRKSRWNCTVLSVPKAVTGMLSVSIACNRHAIYAKNFTKTTLQRSCYIRQLLFC